MNLIPIDLQIVTFCTEFYLKASRERWNRLDDLYSKRAYVEQSILKGDLKAGEIGREQYNRLLVELDNRMAGYDGEVGKRDLIARYLRKLITKLNMIHQGMCGVSHAA